MNILFWMDPPSTFNPQKDTTYLLIHECIQREYKAYFINDIGIENNQFVTHVQRILPFKLGEKIQLDAASEVFNASNISSLWIRKDPPVDENYVRDLIIFEQFSHQIHFINHPLGILKTNEKLAATQFTDFTPATLISQNNRALIEFINKHGHCILKPLNGFGGRGILKVNKDETNVQPILEISTQNFTTQIVCQKAVKHEGGDKRIILLNQTAIGAINRVNHSGHRNNFMAGGHAEKAEITPNDQKIIDAISPTLKENGLSFVGIDIIDNHLIEINVTSPTGIQEMNKLNKTNLQKQS